MCFGCWNDMGRPAEFTADTMKAVAAVQRLYELNCVGGPAHIVTDDWNIEDEDIASCGTDEASGDDPPEVIEAARVVLALFSPMTEAQRATVLAINDGFLPVTR